MSRGDRAADVIVLGAGAAGLMCALTAAARGRDVLVLEANAAPGRKVLVSGGGRCNFTNLDVGPEHFVSSNPHFAKSALARFGPRDFLDLVEAHGIDWREKHLGQLFCVHSSKAILGLLLEECRVAGAPIRTDVEVRHALRDDDGFTVATADGDLSCDALVIAPADCRGPSWAPPTWVCGWRHRSAWTWSNRGPASSPWSSTVAIWPCAATSAASRSLCARPAAVRRSTTTSC